MDGIASDVYDVFHPTPVSLKELSAIVVSLEVWRCKVNEYRNNHKLEDFNPSEERIVLKTMLPDLPSEIYDVIDKNVIKFGFSMDHWLRSHHERVFYFHYNHRNNVLEFFDDFVCEFNGAIHYVRTAEHIMLCDRFDASQKFKIACTYFFEDDIRRLWPLVSRSMDLHNIDFSKSPQLYYWICCLRKELNRMPSTEINVSIEEVMLNVFMPHNRPSLQYFWNRIPLHYRMRRALGIFTRDSLSFARLILPKLNDQQLRGFFNGRIHELMSILFRNVWHDKELILPAWMCIKKAINVDGFTKLVVKMLQDEFFFNSKIIWLDLYCEIWISASEHLKRSALVEITSNKMLFRNLTTRVSVVPVGSKKLKFVATFLSDATSEERRRFWFHYWEELFEYVPRKDLEKTIQRLSFKMG